jgi:hypothetical protein
LVVTVTDPSPGTITITETAGGPPSSGFVIMGFGADISAPPAGVSGPISIVFQIAISALPPGADPNTLVVLKDGKPVGTCDKSGSANPDPCVVEPRTIKDGVLTITVLTSSASHWTFGAPRVTNRIAGSDRVATAIAASTDEFPSGGAKAVVLAQGFTSFADALAGTPLAAAKGGPLLLNGAGSLEPRVLAEIQRVLPPGGTVYLLGGPDALSSSIDPAIKNAGYNPVRLAGLDRYATAVVIADQGLGNPAKVLEATGLNFPDGVAAGAAAAHIGAAVLLTDGPSQAAATAQYLAAHPSDARTAVGGPAAAADPGATPIVGTDRYDTSAQLAQALFGTPSVVGLASGTTFADALAGGVDVAGRGGPVLLVPPTSTPPAPIASYLAANKSTIILVDVFGGPAAISDAMVSAVQAQLAAP